VRGASRRLLVTFALVVALAVSTVVSAWLDLPTWGALFALATSSAALGWGALVHRALRQGFQEGGPARGVKESLVEPRSVPAGCEEGARPDPALCLQLCRESRAPFEAIVEGVRGLLLTAVHEDQRRALAKILDSAEAVQDLNTLALDLLEDREGSRARGQVPFRLREVLGRELRPLGRRAREKGLELVLDVAREVPEEVTGDPRRLGRVVASLVSSALRRTEQGEVVLLVRGGPLSGNGLRFEVVDSARGDPAPAGLDLSLARRMVETMGGQLVVEGGRKEGFLSFVLDLGRPAEWPTEASDEPLLGGLSVLVVDDNTTSGRVLSELMRSWSMKPFAVESGALGLAALQLARDRGQPFDLVLVDREMPGMDGLVLLEKIRETPGLAGVPRILLVLDPDPKEEARARALGATCLAKPVTAPDLCRSIREALSGAGSGAARG
jgi:two-component system sensor histidine kinase/response regulator